MIKEWIRRILGVTGIEPAISVGSLIFSCPHAGGTIYIPELWVPCNLY